MHTTNTRTQIPASSGMSFPTEPCFVQEAKGWDTNITRHPAMVYMHQYEKAFSVTKEMMSMPYTTWHTEDFEYTDALGATYKGDAAWNKHIELYTLLSDYVHEPSYAVINETADGYACFGQAMIFGNLKVPGTKTKTDPVGRSWELAVSSS
jgi:hypothetical protein